MIGDTIIITDKNRSEIRISGRTKHYLNVEGEQLSVQKINRAIEKPEHDLDLEIKEFVASTVLENVQFFYEVYHRHKQTDPLKAAEIIDQELSDNNKNYQVARSKALKGVRVEAVPVEHFYSWSEAFKKLGGQAKIPRVMKEEEFEAFGKYVKSLA